MKQHSTCSQHKKEVAGVSDMKVLAEMIGDLHYETFAELLEYLSDKLYGDGFNDSFDKEKLSACLYDASDDIKCAAVAIQSAWQISKPFMENKKQIE